MRGETDVNSEVQVFALLSIFWHLHVLRYCDTLKEHFLFNFTLIDPHSNTHTKHFTTHLNAAGLPRRGAWHIAGNTALEESRNSGGGR
jgi:hypothetical protein